MLKIEVKPLEFECTIAEVAPGAIFVQMSSQLVGVKTTKKERNDDQVDECIDLQTGEPFMAGTTNFAERDALVVITSQFVKTDE